MSRRVGTCLAAVALLASWSCGDDDDKAGPTRVKAHQISSADDLIGGSDPSGGIGDWYIANDVVEAIIDDPSNLNHIAPSGGTLIDFGHLGRDNDQLVQLYQIYMVSQDLPVKYSSIVAKAEGDVATITLKGKVFQANPEGTFAADLAAGLAVVTEYKLLHGDSKLYVKTTLTNNNSVDINSGFGTPISDVILWGTRSQVPFAPYGGRGFHHPELDIRNPISAFGGYLYVAARSDVEPAVSYGITAPAMEAGLITGVNTTQLTAVGQRPLELEPLKPGGKLIHERIVLIGAESTVDSVARQALELQVQENPDQVPGLGRITGQVTGLPEGRRAQLVAIGRSMFGSMPLNATRTAPDGTYEMTVPIGDYTVEMSFASLEVQTRTGITVGTGAQVAVDSFSVAALATVNYTVLADTAAMPARLTFDPVGETVRPQLGAPYSGEASNNVVYSVDGAGSIKLEPGTYDVYASRGPEYSLAHEQITVAGGDDVTLSFDITKVVNTDGYLAVDAHVHSGASFDSSVALGTRILTMAGEGVDVVISTEHDFIADYAPAVQALGLQDSIATIIGIESTGFVPTPNFPRTIGHNNAWPVAVQPGMARNGAPADEDVEPGEVYERLRAVAVGTPVIQVNHARAYSAGTIGLGYFTNFSFNPTLPIPATDDGGINAFLRIADAPGGTDNLGFDCMEVFNGAAWINVVTNMQNRADWFALIKQGFIKTATANSDTHSVTLETAGYPRNYVAYASDSPANLDVESLNQSFLTQRVVGSTGPFITVSVQGSNTAGMGDTATSDGGMVTVSVKVQAAPWIPVEEIRILLNGEEVCGVTTSEVRKSAEAVTCPVRTPWPEPTDPFGTDGVIRYEADVQVSVAAGDAFIVVEAGQALPAAADTDADGVIDTFDTNGDGDASDEVAGALPPFAAPKYADIMAPGLMPWAFTNPIFVDLEADGWSAPGL